jgi:hypothetical protein
MILDIVPLVDRLVPGLLHGDRRSVACVCTTRPKFLVFDDDATHPKCVVEFGDRDRLTRTDRILSELGSRMAAIVPASLFCGPIHNGTVVHIQAGLPGVPWFRVSDGVATPQAWRTLLARAVATMVRLHEATREVPAWNGTVNIGCGLDRQATLCSRNGTALSRDVLQRIQEWRPALTEAGPVRGCWQHGDFSLNNLLVSADSIAIIDFEEFGGTDVPLHDAFGLALSVPLSQDGRCPLSIRECIAESVERARLDEGIEAAHLPSLLMHHLLWRINQCHAIDRRSRLRETLRGWAHALADAPEVFFAEHAAPALH